VTVGVTTDTQTDRQTQVIL